MWNIIKLDKTLANQIAAWEVVERPVSVVKELVENSIDAWATEIKIEIKWWWIEEIIITDNWNWIDKEDMGLAIEKYSTSKIKTIEDLYKVMTFWFRWEALASISSVSDFQIISKTSNSKFWYFLSTHWWDNQKFWDISAETWTKIIVKNLFFNTPARLNYLKTVRTEYNNILEFLNAMSLAYPKIWFEFISDWRSIFKFNKWEDLKTRIYSIYWEEFLNNLLEVDFSIPWVIISWYISDPKISFSNKNRQNLFVNKRIIKSPLIYKAISDAYNRFIPHGNFPWYVLNLEVNPTEIDVNVHPRKLEVRFASEQTIFKSVYSAISNKLENVSLVSNNESFQQWIKEKKYFQPKLNNYYVGSWTKFKSYSPYKDVSSNPDQYKIKEAINFTKEILSNSEENKSNSFEKSNDLHETAIWKIIWQAFNSYIIVETKEWIKILDQHALAERIIYEKLVSNSYSSNTQKLLLWESLNLTPKEISILEENKNVFFEMWFDFEIMSNRIVILNWIPDFIKKENLSEIFLWILDDIWEYGLTKSKTLDEVKNKIYAYTACRSAIKFWNKLNLFEINKLLNDAILDYSSTCPHWRPVVFEIWLDELKDKYER